MLIGFPPVLQCWRREALSRLWFFQNHQVDILLQEGSRGNGTPLQYSCLENLWTEEPGRLQSMGSLRVGHDWATSLSLFTFMHWRRKWQPTTVFLPGKLHGQRSLAGCSPWGHRESDTTWWLTNQPINVRCKLIGKSMQFSMLVGKSKMQSTRSTRGIKEGFHSLAEKESYDLVAGVFWVRSWKVSVGEFGGGFALQETRTACAKV